eukprot:TRINITY_DN60009_c0_g1_i1.p1 TRINITY_DN60009_c0_g1~~TRINITY_DN60009_c0_g1_i1.p1  ORF type:complete len:170 (-),score=17.04 TRINITY_DN60009_c0_g1_i1:25-534(-)
MQFFGFCYYIVGLFMLCRFMNLRPMSAQKAIKCASKRVSRWMKTIRPTPTCAVESFDNVMPTESQTSTAAVADVEERCSLNLSEIADNITCVEKLNIPTIPLMSGRRRTPPHGPTMPRERSAPPQVRRDAWREDGGIRFKDMWDYEQKEMQQVRRASRRRRTQTDTGAR